MVSLVLRDLWRTYCNTERTRHQNYGAEGGLLTFYSVFAKRGSNEFTALRTMGITDICIIMLQMLKEIFRSNSVSSDRLNNGREISSPAL